MIRSSFSLLILVVILSAGLLAVTLYSRNSPAGAVRAERDGIRVITLDEAAAYYTAGSHRFIDARSAAEFSSGSIAGSLSLPLPEIERRQDTLWEMLDSGVPVIVYCSSRACEDALYLAEELQAMGFTNLLYYADGYQAWEKAGLPIGKDRG